MKEQKNKKGKQEMKKKKESTENVREWEAFGMTKAEWEKMDYFSRQTLHQCGFKNKEEVHRALINQGCSKRGN